LRDWGHSTLGMSHVSTPQVRIYSTNCWRNLVKDQIEAKWHYILAVSRNQGRTARELSFLTANLPKIGFGVMFRDGEISRIPTTFDELVVHEVAIPYGVSKQNVSSTLGDACVLLDGYFW